MAEIIDLEERRRQKQQGCEAWAAPQNFGGFTGRGLNPEETVTAPGLTWIERAMAFVKPCPYKLHDD